MELRAAISASRLMRGKSGKQNRHRNKRLGASQVSFWEISGNEEKLLDKIKLFQAVEGRAGDVGAATSWRQLVEQQPCGRL